MDNPVGDSYFIVSVEEFYCDVGKDQLKMSQKQKKAPPTHFQRLSILLHGFLQMT